LLSDSELEVLSRKKKKKEEEEKKQEIKMTPVIYHSVNNVVNSALKEIAPLEKGSNENGLCYLEKWKEFDYYGRSWWIKRTNIKDTFPCLFTQISIFLTMNSENYYHSLQCRRMMSVIVVNPLTKQ
jgi:hypothetical protein